MNTGIWWKSLTFLNLLYWNVTMQEREFDTETSYEKFYILILMWQAVAKILNANTLYSQHQKYWLISLPLHRCCFSNFCCRTGDRESVKKTIIDSRYALESIWWGHAWNCYSAIHAYLIKKNYLVSKTMWNKFTEAAARDQTTQKAIKEVTVMGQGIIHNLYLQF